MAIRFDCPHCLTAMTIREEMAGKKGRCPSCKETILVPVAVEETPEPFGYEEAAPAPRPKPVPPPPPPRRGPSWLDEENEDPKALAREEAVGWQRVETGLTYQMIGTWLAAGGMGLLLLMFLISMGSVGSSSSSSSVSGSSYTRSRGPDFGQILAMILAGLMFLSWLGSWFLSIGGSASAACAPARAKITPLAIISALIPMIQFLRGFNVIEFTMSESSLSRRESTFLMTMLGMIILLEIARHTIFAFYLCGCAKTLGRERTASQALLLGILIPSVNVFLGLIFWLVPKDGAVLVIFAGLQLAALVGFLVWLSLVMGDLRSHLRRRLS